MRSGRFKICAVLTLFLSVITGCGYHFSAQEDGSKKAGISIYVAPFANGTRELYVDQYVRNALTDWFLKSTRMIVTLKEEEADVVLSGRIVRIYTMPLSYRTGNLAAEESVRLIMEVTLKDRRSGKVYWEEKNLVGEQSYSVTDPNRRNDERRVAIIKLAYDLGERIYRPALTSF